MNPINSLVVYCVEELEDAVNLPFFHLVGEQFRGLEDG